MCSWAGAPCQRREFLSDKLREAARLAAGHGLDVVGRDGLQARREQPMEDRHVARVPVRRAGLGHRGRDRLRGDADVPDRPPRRRAELPRSLVERDRLRPRDRVGLALMAVLGQGGGRDGGDVAHVDHRDLAVLSGRVDRAVGDHREEVLHEERRAQNCVAKARARDLRLGLSVPAGELHRGPLVRGEHRQLHDAPNARPHRGPDHMTLPCELLRARGHEQKHAIDAVERCRHGIRLVEVAVGGLDVAAEHRARPLNVTGNHAHLLAGLEQQRHEPGSDPSSCPRDRDHRLPPSARSAGVGRRPAATRAARRLRSNRAT